MKTALKLAMAGMAVSLGTLAACTAHHGHGKDKLKEHIESALKKAGASDEQLRKIAVVTDRLTADCAELHRNNRGLGARFVDRVLLDTPDKEWLHRTVDEKAVELTAFAHRTVDGLIEISGMLTGEQRAALKKRYDAAHGAKTP